MSFPRVLSGRNTWTLTPRVSRDWTTRKPEAWWGADEQAALWKQISAWLMAVAAREPSREAVDVPTKVPMRQGVSSQYLPGLWCKFKENSLVLLCIVSSRALQPQSVHYQEGASQESRLGPPTHLITPAMSRKKMRVESHSEFWITSWNGYSNFWIESQLIVQSEYKALYWLRVSWKVTRLKNQNKMCHMSIFSGIMLQYRYYFINIF